MTLAVAEALGPNKPNQIHSTLHNMYFVLYCYITLHGTKYMLYTGTCTRGIHTLHVIHYVLYTIQSDLDNPCCFNPYASQSEPGLFDLNRLI